MPRRFAVLGASAALLASGLLVASLTPASSQATAETVKLCDQDRSGFNKDIDVGKKGFSAGDYSVFTDPLLDTQSGRRKGKFIGQFVFIKPLGERNGIFSVDANAFLPDGKVSVSAVGRFSSLRDGAVFPVTGGTGGYKNVRGTVAAREGSCDGKGGLRFRFELRTQ